jgi:hypothetical protein
MNCSAALEVGVAFRIGQPGARSESQSVPASLSCCAAASSLRAFAAAEGWTKRWAISRPSSGGFTV